MAISEEHEISLRKDITLATNARNAYQAYLKIKLNDLERDLFQVFKEGTPENAVVAKVRMDSLSLVRTSILSGIENGNVASKLLLEEDEK